MGKTFQVVLPWGSLLLRGTTCRFGFEDDCSCNDGENNVEDDYDKDDYEDNSDDDDGDIDA